MIRSLSRLAFYFGLVLVVILSLIPQDVLPPTGISDKANHVAAYTALALAGGIGFRGVRRLMLVAAGLLLLGASLELAQSVLPDHVASLYDLLADAIGIMLGALLATGTDRVWLRHRPTGG
jgi:VanZ family protein